MNHWNQDNNYFQMQNMMGMGMGHAGPPMPQPPRSNKPPLLPPPQYLLPEMNMPINPAPQVSAPLLPGPPTTGPPLIGPVMPDNMNSVDMTMGSDEEENAKQAQEKNAQDTTDEKEDNKDSKEIRDRDNRSRARDNRRDRNRDEGRGRYDSRGQREPYDRNRNDRNRDRSDRSRDRERDRRDRRSKWGDDNSQMPGEPGGVVMPGLLGHMPGMPISMPGMPGNAPGMPGNLPGMQNTMPGMQGPMPGMQGSMPGMQGSIPGQIMPSYGNMNEMGFGQQQIDMGNMQNMGNIQNMGNMPNMGNLSSNMMPGMNMMMPNMMNQNMMMNQQPMIMPNQPMYVTGAVLLPPNPGTTMPARREKPLGCRTIFVGGLPVGIVRSVIEEMFQNFGTIVDIKLHRGGVCHVRFDNMESVEKAFMLSGYRVKTNDMTENEATTLFVDYALNRDDQHEYERNQRLRGRTPPRVEFYSATNLEAVSEKIKSEDKFAEAAPTLISWLERGECNKKNANSFYSLIQASNNQVRRLYNDKMALDEEYQNMKISFRDKFASIVNQFEQVAKILSAAKQQRVSDHFTKQQRRNIDMWLKMTEELDNIKEEFNANFDDEEIEKTGRNVVPAERYEQLKTEYDNLMYELEGYKNEAYLAKDEAERKFEKFKAHFIAQQALQNKQQVFPPLPPPLPLTNMATVAPLNNKPQPPPPTPDDDKVITSGPSVPASEAKLISILTAFLMVHPLGASLDYLVSYVRSMSPNVTQATVNNILQKYTDVFVRNTTGIGANIEHRWSFVTFDAIKAESQSEHVVKFKIGESKRV